MREAKYTEIVSHTRNAHEYFDVSQYSRVSAQYDTVFGLRTHTNLHINTHAKRKNVNQNNRNVTFNMTGRKKYCSVILESKENICVPINWIKIENNSKRSKRLIFVSKDLRKKANFQLNVREILNKESDGCYFGYLINTFGKSLLNFCDSTTL